MLVVSFLVMATIVAQTSSQNATLPSFFYPIDGSELIPEGDDNDSGEVTLDVPFPFFGNKFNSLWVNTNGLITFDMSYTWHEPTPFPIDRQIISPYWADVNTDNIEYDYVNDDNATRLLRLDGWVYYLQTQNQSILTRAQNDVKKIYNGNIQVASVFIATWYKVAMIDQRFTENTFQCVLITDGTRSFTIFHYGDIVYRGFYHDSDNQPPGIGYSAGKTYSFNHPNSNSALGVDIETTTNTDINGQWILRLDNNDTAPIPCV